MKFLSLFALVGLTLAGDYEKEDGVLVLTNDNFAEAVAEFDYLLAEFYAPWCGHCKSLAPEYAKAAQKLAGQENIALAKIDATVEADIAKKYGVRGYPTLKWFKKDPENAMEYGGGRKEPEIVSWINKKTGPSALNLDDVEAANKFKSDNEVNVIGYFPEGSDSAAFIAAADSIDDVPFGITSNADVAKELDLAEGGVTLFKAFDEGFNKYAEGDLAAFVKENMLAYVTEFSDKTAPKIFGGEIKKTRPHLLCCLRFRPRRTTRCLHRICQIPQRKSSLRLRRLRQTRQRPNPRILWLERRRLSFCPNDRNGCFYAKIQT